MDIDEITGPVLTITAHPDDVDFGAAGTVATLTGRGVEVVYCIVTDGDAGGFDDDVPRRDMPAIRRSEQTDAAKVVGVSDLRFLGYPDGRLEATLDLRRDLARVIRQVRPGLVLCPSPERDYSRIFASHPDHLAAGEAAVCAVYPDARNPYAFPELLDEGLEPHTVGLVWMMASPTADVAVDVTDVIDRKLQALLCHRSQLPDPDQMEQRVRGFLGANAERAGLGSGRLAEVFRELVTA